MNTKAIKYITTFLLAINCLTFLPKPTVASAASYSLGGLKISTYYAHKDKSNGFNVFGEENYKYLSAKQKKELLELKKCKDKGQDLSEEQQKTLHSLIDSIIKGKLGDKDYVDFKSLVEKKRSNENLTDEENERLKDYTDIINGNKLSTKDILSQFLR